MRLKAGTTIDTFTEVEERQVEDLQSQIPCEVTDISATQETEGNKVPEHLEGSYKAAKRGSKEPLQSTKLARLLTEYSTVFSTGDRDVGLTTLVKHSIPVKESTQSLHQIGSER